MRLLLHVVALSAWREHCETLVWCEGKHNCLNSRYDSLPFVSSNDPLKHLIFCHFHVLSPQRTVYLFCKLPMHLRLSHV